MFPKDLLAQLKQQMHANFQIITQAYVIQREVYGPQHVEVQWWENNLRQVSAQDYCAQVLTTGPHSALAVTGANRIMEIFKLPDFNITSDKTVEFKAKYQFQSSQGERNKIEKKIQKNHEMGVKNRVVIDRHCPLVYPDSLRKVLYMFKDSFDVKLFPVIYRVRLGTTKNFTAEEDELLCLGCRIFGFEDRQSVRSLFLPARSINQIYKRFRYLCSRASKDNSLKTLYLMPFKPMNAYDRHVLISVC